MGFKNTWNIIYNESTEVSLAALKGDFYIVSSDITGTPSTGDIEFHSTGDDRCILRDGYLHLIGVTSYIKFPDGSLMNSASIGSSGNISNTTDAIVVADSDNNSSGDILMKIYNTVALTIDNATKKITSAFGFVGDLTGNADTVTNGVYTVGDQTITGTKTFGSGAVSDTRIPIHAANNTSAGIEMRADASLISGSDLYYDGNINSTIFNTVASSVATECIRINSSGQVGIGNSSPDELLVVGSAAIADNKIKIISANNSEAGLEMRGDNSGANGSDIIYDGGSNSTKIRGVVAGTPTTQLEINSSGIKATGTVYSSNLTGGAINASINAAGEIIRDPSDERAKEDYKKIESPLDKVMNLEGKEFKFKESSGMGTNPRFGLIAQEVASVDEKLTATAAGVTELSKDLKIENMMSIDHAGLIALLIESMKELKSEIENIKLKLED